MVEDILFKDYKKEKEYENPLIEFAEKLSFIQPESISSTLKRNFDQQLQHKPEEERTEQLHIRLPKDFIQIERYLEESFGIFSKNRIYGCAIEHGLCLYMGKNFGKLREVYHLRNRLVLSDNQIASQLYSLKISTPLMKFFKDFSETPSTVRIQPQYKFLIGRMADETNINQSDLCRVAIVYSLFTSERATELKSKFDKIIKEDLAFIDDYVAFLENSVCFFTGKDLTQVRKQINDLRNRKHEKKII